MVGIDTSGAHMVL